MQAQDTELLGRNRLPWHSGEYEQPVANPQLQRLTPGIRVLRQVLAVIYSDDEQRFIPAGSVPGRPARASQINELERMGLQVPYIVSDTKQQRRVRLTIRDQAVRANEVKRELVREAQRNEAGLRWLGRQVPVETVELCTERWRYAAERCLRLNHERATSEGTAPRSQGY